ncbi:MAG: hypothetical protein U0169_25305 [Polyangiaceae bacterium]
MKDVDFFKLPRSVQERFAGSVAGTFVPHPILARRGGLTTPRTWFAIAGGSTAALLVLYALGHGSLSSPLAIQGAPFAVVYVVLAFVATFGFGRGLALSLEGSALPYTRGLYLFPTALVDARWHPLKVAPLSDVEILPTLSKTGGLVAKVVSGGTFEFAPPKEGSVDDQRAAIERARANSAAAEAAGDPNVLVELDPLFEPRFSNPIGARESLKKTGPAWAKFVVVGSVGVGLAVGVLVWFVRYVTADDRLFVKASAVNDPAAYRMYLEKGSRHRDDVVGILLPRAELREAQAEKTVTAVETYVRTHPNSRIQKEVDAALRAAMLDELARATEKKNLVSLREFEKAHPNHGVGPELARAIHAVYERALADWKSKVGSKDAALVQFVTRLFAFAESKGPNVEIRFQRKPSTLWKAADGHIAKYPTFLGSVSYPSVYFDAIHEKKRMEALGPSLVTGLTEAFPRELVAFTIGAPVISEDGTLPTVTVPTLFVAHRAEWSLLTYTLPNPRGIIGSIGFTFDTTFALPDDAKPYKGKYEFNVMPMMDVFKAEKRDAAYNAPEERTYQAMAESAQKKFTTKLLASFGVGGAPAK